MSDGYDFVSFAKIYEAGKGQVLYKRIVADLETPIGTYLKLAEGRRYSFLLESVEGGAVRGRYSMIGLEPDLLWRVRDGVAEINRTAQTASDAYCTLGALPLDALRTLIAESQIDMPKELPANSAGVFGYLGYDMVRFMEELPDTNPDTIGGAGRHHDAALDACRVRHAQGRIVSDRTGLSPRGRYGPAGV